MGFYFRKSIKLGALRFNFSQSGVGVSAGVKGFRIGTGPRGNYIHAGTNGFYYRKTIGNTNKLAVSLSANNQMVTDDYSFKDIESGNVSFMTDSSFEDIIDELNKKGKIISLVPISIVASIVLSFINQIGILSFAVFLPCAYLANKKLKTTHILYDFEEQKEKEMQVFYDSFDSLISSSKAWHINSSAGVNTEYGRKINAGATNLVRRNSILIKYGLPKYIESNVKVPVIPVGKQVLVFLPERILIKDGKQYGTINYKDLDIKYGNTQFIESQGVPNDSEVVGSTWKYVNKKGGPDKRFKDNIQLPIVKYSEIHFKSETGLNELIQVSKANIGSEIVKALSNKN